MFQRRLSFLAGSKSSMFGVLSKKDSKPLSPYELFSQEERIDRPDLADSEVSELWAALPMDEKKPFVDDATRQMERWRSLTKKTSTLAVSQRRNPKTPELQFYLDELEVTPKLEAEIARKWAAVPEEEKKLRQMLYEKEGGLSFSAGADSPRKERRPSPPANPYLRFLKDQTILKGVDVIQRSKKWGMMTEEEKQPYVETYRAELATFHQDNSAVMRVVESGPTSSKNKISRKLDGWGAQSSLDEEGRPRPVARNAYIFFYKEQGALLKGVDLVQRAKVLGARWKSMSQAEKEPYVEAQKAAAATFQQENPTRVSKVDRVTDRPRKALTSGTDATTGEIVTPAGGKKPMSPFFRYLKSVRDGVKEANPTYGQHQIAKVIGAQWKDLSEEKKRPYVEQFAAERAANRNKTPGYRPRRTNGPEKEMYNTAAEGRGEMLEL